MVKEWFKDFLATTALTLILVSCFALITGDTTVHLLSIFPSIIANAIIHLGLLAIRLVDLKHYLVEIVCEVSFVLGVVLVVGHFAGWFRLTPIWVTVAIALTVFVVACLINVSRLNHSLSEINLALSNTER